MPLRDLDLQGHVFHGEYLPILDEARNRWLREVLSLSGADSYVIARVEIDFRAPLTRIDGAVDVHFAISRVGNTSITLLERMRSCTTGTIATEALTTLVMWDRAAGRPQPLTREDRQAARAQAPFLSHQALTEGTGHSRRFVEEPAASSKAWPRGPAQHHPARNIRPARCMTRPDPLLNYYSTQVGLPPQRCPRNQGGIADTEGHWAHRTAIEYALNCRYPSYIGRCPSLPQRILPAERKNRVNRRPAGGQSRLREEYINADASRA